MTSWEAAIADQCIEGWISHKYDEYQLTSLLQWRHMSNKLFRVTENRIVCSGFLRLKQIKIQSCTSLKVDSPHWWIPRTKGQ